MGDRVIKFRAWDGEKMVDDWLVFTQEHTQVLATNKTGAVEAVMQYTGLKDKNGEEIYEGDILADVTLGHTRIAGAVQWFNETDESGMSTYGYYTQHGVNPTVTAALSPKPARHLEVIGNIYEDPELFK